MIFLLYKIFKKCKKKIFLIDKKAIYFSYIVCVYSSYPSHQFFSRVGMFPGLNQYLADDEVFC